MKLTPEQAVSNRLIAEWCGYRAKQWKRGDEFKDKWYMVKDDRPHDPHSSWYVSEAHTWERACPDFFTDPAAFSELLDVCAAKGLMPQVWANMKGVWTACIEVPIEDYKVGWFEKLADTKFEALALVVLELIKQEGVRNG